MTSGAPSASRSRPPAFVVLIGWVLVGAGACVLLYLLYALLFTNIGADQAQDELRDQWRAQAAPAEPTVAERDAVVAERDADGPQPDGDRAEPLALPEGPALALVEFVRPGSATPPVHDEPLVVLEGVTTEVLAKGPGHYPSTAGPGEDGNFAVAGHRTTYGAPFYHLDALRDGDQILVTDRRGTRHTYEVVEQHVVGPSDVWVIGHDPLGRDGATMTLTTCHPRFSAAERLIVHAELMS